MGLIVASMGMQFGLAGMKAFFHAKKQTRSDAVSANIAMFAIGSLRNLLRILIGARCQTTAYKIYMHSQRV